MLAPSDTKVGPLLTYGNGTMLWLCSVGIHYTHAAWVSLDGDCRVGTFRTIPELSMVYRPIVLSSYEYLKVVGVLTAFLHRSPTDMGTKVLLKELEVLGC